MSKKKESLLSKIRSKPKPKADSEIPLLIEEVQSDPSDMRTRLKLADAYFKGGEKLKALDQYLTVAETYAEKAFYPKAVAVYKRALEIDPQMIEVYLKLAHQYMKLGLMAEVVQNYTKAAELHEKAGRKKEALDTFRLLIDLSPENAIGHLKLGQRYLSDSFQKEAIDEFMKTYNIFERQKKTAESQKLLEGLLERGIEDHKIIRPLLELYERNDDQEKIFHVLSSLKMDISGSVALQEALAYSAQKQGENAKALDAYEKVVRLYEKSGRPDLIVDTCRKILEIDPNNTLARSMSDDYLSMAEAVKGPPPIELAEIEEPPLGKKEIPAEEPLLKKEAPEAAEAEVEIPEELPSIEKAAEEFTVEEAAEDLGKESAVTVEDVWKPTRELAPEEQIEEMVEVFEEPKPAGEEKAEDIDLFAEPTEEVVEEIDEAALLKAEEHPVEEAKPEEESVDLFAETEAAPQEITEEISEETPVEEAKPEVESVDLFAEPAEIEEIPSEIEQEIAEPDPAIPEVDYERLSAEEAAEHLDEVRALATEAGRPERFVEYLNDLYNKFPRDIPVLESLRAVATEHGDEEAAVRMLALLADSAEDAGLPERLGTYLEELVQAAPSDRHFRRRLADHYRQTDPEGAIIHYTMLAHEAIGREDYEEGEDCLAQILSIDPRNIGAMQDRLELYRALDDKEKIFNGLSALAEIYLEQSDDPVAQILLEEAADLRPDHFETAEKLLGVYRRRLEITKASALLRRLARAATDDGDLKFARDLYSRLLDLDRESIDTRSEIKEVCILSDDLPGAVEQLRALSAIELSKGRNDRAEAYLREAMALLPEAVELKESLIDFFKKSGQDKKAAEEMAALADVHAAKNETKEAGRLYRLAVESAPERLDLRRKLVEFLRKTDRVSDAVHQLYLIADAHERAREYDRAEGVFREILSFDPKEEKAYQLLKDLYILTGQEEKAVTELFRMAELAAKAGDEQKALALYGEIAGIDSENVEAREGIRKLHMAAGNIDAAVGEMVAVARIRERSDDIDGACETLRQVLKLRPDDYEAFVMLKGLYLRSGMIERLVALLSERSAQAESAGRIKEALSLLQEIITAAPDNLSARNRKKDLLIASGDIDGAVAELSSLADLFEASGKSDKVVDSLKDVLRLVPKNIDTRMRLKDLYLDLDQTAKALEVLHEILGIALDSAEDGLAKETAEEILVLDEKDRAALDAMANLAEKAGTAEAATEYLYRLADLDQSENRLSEALACLQRAAVLLPEDIELRRRLSGLAHAMGDTDAEIEQNLLLAELCVKSDRRDEAAQTYRAVLAVKPRRREALSGMVELLRTSDAAAESIGYLFTLSEISTDAGDSLSAEKELETILSIEPGNSTALEKLSELHLSIGDTEKAVREIFELEAAEEDKGEFDRAIDLLKKIKETEPQNLQASQKLIDLYELTDRSEEMIAEIGGLAQIHQERGDIGEAQSAFRRIIALRPDNERAHEDLKASFLSDGDTAAAVAEQFRYADILLNAGATAEAEEAIREVLVLDSGNERAAFTLADLYKKSGETDKAVLQLMSLAESAREANRTSTEEDALRQVIALEPLNADAQHSLKRLYLSAGDSEKAIDVLFEYGRTAFEHGEKDTALKVYKGVLEIEPSSERALTSLKDLLLSARDVRGALEYLDRLTAMASDRSDFAHLEACLKEAVAIDALDMDRWTHLKDFYLDTGAKAKAVAALFDTLEALGEALGEGEAEGLLLEVLMLEPDDEKALRKLKDLYRTAGNTESAVRYTLALADALKLRGQNEALEPLFREVLSLDPDNETARTDLVDIQLGRGETESAAGELVLLAELYRRTGRYDQAQKALFDVVDLGVQKEHALTMLKEIYLAQGDQTKALQTTGTLADLAVTAKEYDVAENHLREILRLDEKNMEARERLVSVLETEGKTGEAIGELQNLADRSGKAGNIVARESYLRRIVEADPDHFQARAALLKILESAHRTEGRLEQVEELIRIYKFRADADALEKLYHKKLALLPNDEATLSELADLYLVTGEKDKAVLLLFVPAEDALAEGNFDKAVELFNRVKEIDPVNEAVYTKLCEVCLARDDKEGAVSELLSLVDMDIRTRRFTAAEKHLRDIFSIDAHNHEAQERLAQLFMHSAEEKAKVADLLKKAEKALAAGALDESKAFLEQIIATDPDNPEAKSLLNAIYFRRPKPARLEEEEFFEDVNVEFQDQGSVNISWDESSKAVTEEAPAEEETPTEEGVPETEEMPAAASEIDIFAEPAEEAPIEEAAVEETPIEEVDLFGEAAEAPVEETAPEEAAAQAEVDLFGETEAPAEETATEPPVEAEGEVDLFADETIGEPEPEIIPAADDAQPVDVFETVEEEPLPGKSEIRDVADLFETPEEPEPELPPVHEITVDEFRETEPEKALPPEEPIEEEIPAEPDLFAEPPAEEPTDLFAEEPAPKTASAESEAISGILDDLFGPAEPERKKEKEEAAGDTFDDFFSELAGEEHGAEAKKETLDSMADEFKSMIGEETPKNAETHYTLGIAFREMEQTHEAIAEFEKALALGETEKVADIANQLARCYLEIENWEQSAEYFEMALEQSGKLSEPVRLDLQMDLGFAYVKMREYKRAIKIYTEVDRANPNYRGVKAEIEKAKKKLSGDDNISYV